MNRKLKYDQNKFFISLLFIIFQKELMFKIERMTEESNKKKRAVESEIMDTTTLQVNDYFLQYLKAVIV